MRQQADADTRYSPDAFAAQIGQRVALTLQGQQAGTATVVAVVVAEDGCSVEITVDIDDERVIDMIGAGVLRSASVAAGWFLSGPVRSDWSVPREGPHLNFE